MVTGYEVKMYADIGRIADNLGRCAAALEKLAAQADTQDEVATMVKATMRAMGAPAEGADEP